MCQQLRVTGSMLVGRFLLLAFVNAMTEAQTALALHVGRSTFGRVAAGKVGGQRHDDAGGGHWADEQTAKARTVSLQRGSCGATP
jgi:hypothetical protein